MDTITEKEAKTVKLLKSELELVENQLIAYKEGSHPDLWIMSRKEKSSYDMNREVLKAQKNLLVRIIATAEAIIY